MSDFCPDKRGVVVDTLLGSLGPSRCGEGGTLQTNNAGVCLQCLSHIGPAPTHGACALPAHSAQALCCSTGNHPRLALGCMHLPGLSRSGSGTQEFLRGAESVGPAFCALPRSEVFGKHGRCDLSPAPSLPHSFLGVQLVHLLRRMLIVQNPKKS